jgi:hypothetical protein
MGRAELKPYLDHLLALPFIRGARIVREAPAGRSHADYELALKTQGAERRFLAEVTTSHVTRELIERWASTAAPRENHILFAPAIGQELGDRLEHLGLGFVDRAGNCYLNLSDRHVARIQGKRAERRPPAEKGLRAPAYRALFALLADPTLTAAPVRTLAQAAGISRQAADDIRHRLEALGILFAAKRRFGWVKGRATKTIDLFITGYVTTLRPQLLLGRYRTPASKPDVLEQSITTALTTGDGVLWGGGAAAMRLNRYYRGSHTILHSEKAPTDFLKRIKAIPDRNGSLELLGFPGPLALRGATDDTAHPLLVYAELMLENHDRAREAAQDILERWLPEERYA